MLLGNIDRISPCIGRPNLCILLHVYDVSYPDTMSGILYFFWQDVALLIQHTVYSSFMAELRDNVHTIYMFDLL